jgi:hypothetical protein
MLTSAYAEKGNKDAEKASLADALNLRPELTLAWLRMHPFSNEPDYLKLANAIYYDGLRKAGLA